MAFLSTSNALLVRATEDQFTVIEDVTREIDDATVTTSREMRTIPIDGSRASAADIARILERILERGGDDDEVQVIPLDELLEKYGSSDEKKDAPAKDTRSGAFTPGDRHQLLAVALLGNLPASLLMPLMAGEHHRLQTILALFAVAHTDGAVFQSACRGRGSSATALG